MTTVPFKQLSEIIKERHSVRKFDSAYKIPREEIEGMLKEATLAPSSSNLQPWRFIVIEDQASKKELRSIAYNQEQVEMASVVIAVLGDMEMYENAEKVFQSAFELGFMTEENTKKMIENTVNLYSKAPNELRKNIATYDAGLVSMQIMLIAKDRGYDTVPMSGFNKEKFMEEFNVSERFFPIVLIPLGKAAVPAHSTTRLPLEDVLLKYV
ncbi:MAG: nitroreductase family protein [Bacillota bacterium]|jgi:nitroreductase|nr:nitroreductase family protein [Bacillota bacterium]